MSFEALPTPSTMAAFYAEQVHSHIFADPDQTLAKYRRRVHSELTRLGIDPASLRNKTLLDIGSGWQTIVFHELGCRRVFHLDINPLHSEFLNRYTTERSIDTIISTTIDVCRSMGPAEAVDLAFVAGVYHHLSDREGFLSQLLPAMAANGQILFRVYRSGTWSRWLVSELRSASVNRLTADALLLAYRMLRPHDCDGQFVGDMVDDLLTPQWLSFHPDQFKADADALSLDYRCDEERFEVDFSDRDENFRLTWRLDHSPPQPAYGQLATGREHVAELIVPLWLEELQHVLRVLLARLNHHSDRDAATVLVSLYLMVRRHAGYDPFCGTVGNAAASADLAAWRVKSLSQVIGRLQDWLAA